MQKKKAIEALEQELKILLLFPRIPMMTRTSFWEIQNGAGGDEAALFAAELYRMYVNYSESQHWKVELISVIETERRVQGSRGHGHRKRSLFQAEIRERCSPCSACSETESETDSHFHSDRGGYARGGGGMW